MFMKKFGTAVGNISKTAKKVAKKILLVLDKVVGIFFLILDFLKSLMYMFVPIVVIGLIILENQIKGFQLNYESLTLLMVLLAYFRYFDDKD